MAAAAAAVAIVGGGGGGWLVQVGAGLPLGRPPANAECKPKTPD